MSLLVKMPAGVKKVVGLTVEDVNLEKAASTSRASIEANAHGCPCRDERPVAVPLSEEARYRSCSKGLPPVLILTSRGARARRHPTWVDIIRSSRKRLTPTTIRQSVLAQEPGRACARPWYSPCPQAQRYRYRRDNKGGDQGQYRINIILAIETIFDDKAVAAP